MRTAQVRAALDLKGTSIPKIAAENGFSHQAITNVNSGRTRSRRIETIIAEALELPLHAVFPDYYSAPSDYKPRKIEIDESELLELRNQFVIATRTIERLCAA